jgi:hypothetical protein
VRRVAVAMDSTRKKEGDWVGLGGWARLANSQPLGKMRAQGLGGIKLLMGYEMIKNCKSHLEKSFWK